MAEYFPKGHFDVNAQQVDLRDKNSWLLKLEEVSTTELIEGTICSIGGNFVKLIFASICY